MINKKYWGIFWLASLALSGIFLWQYLDFSDSRLKIDFFDVGQGDATLISQGHRRVLVDGGPSETQLMEKLGRAIPFWDRRIDVIILTHPDQDHLAGLMAAVERYQVGTIIKSAVKHDSPLAAAFDQLIQQQNIPVLKAEPNLKIVLSDEAFLQILYPFSGEEFRAEESNAGSVVARLSFGENSFLLTGDLPIQEENELLKNYPQLTARVLKVSHHGSKYGTGADFLKTVRPEAAIISVGKNNLYGHPSGEALERLRQQGSQIWRTDEVGDIRYLCAAPENLCQGP